MKNESGLTILEFLVAALLISVVFLASTTVYVGAVKFFSDLRQNADSIDSFILMENLTRKVTVANQVSVSDAGKQLKIRWDWQLIGGVWTPNNTPDVTTDDTWVKYRFLGASNDLRLRWRSDATETTDVTNPDPEVRPGVVARDACLFTLVNASGDGDPIAVDVNLVTQTGTPPVIVTLTNRVLAGARSKN